MGDEYVELVAEDGRSAGRVTRAAAHSDPSLIHRVVHVLVLNRRSGREEILLQKRSALKDIAPGLWDVSVGGHVIPGEAPLEAAKREMLEELGVTCADITFCYSYLFRGKRESEHVSTFSCRHPGPFSPNPDEIDEVRFFGIEEINGRLGSGFFSENFEAEFNRYKAHAG